MKSSEVIIDGANAWNGSSSSGVHRLQGRSSPLPLPSKTLAPSAPALPAPVPMHEDGDRQERRCWHQFQLAALVGLALFTVFIYVRWVQDAKSSRDRVTGKVVMHSSHYFVLCFIGGIIAGLAHVLVTPLDLIKCRIQVGEYTSFEEAFYKICIIESRGSMLRAVPLLFRGWVPTLVGYCIQGALKFSLYEIFKYVLLVRPSAAFGDAAAGVKRSRRSGTEAAAAGSGSHGGWYEFAIFLFSSFLAEFIADFGLAPWEAIKVKMQTTNIHPPYLHIVLPRMWVSEGCHSFYKGIVPLWCRQVPYTMMKFASFEKVVGVLQKMQAAISTSSQPPGKATQLCITLLAGISAGVLCCIVSHPADTLVSKLNQGGRGAAAALADDDDATSEIREAAAKSEAAVMITTTSADDVHQIGGVRATSISGLQSSFNTSGTMHGASGAAPYPRRAVTGSAASVMSSPLIPKSPSTVFLNVNLAGSSPAPVASSLLALVKEIGWRGLWKGLGPRLLMVSVMTSLQWLLYDGFKVFAGLPTTGSKK